MHFVCIVWKLSLSKIWLEIWLYPQSSGGMCIPVGFASGKATLVADTSRIKSEIPWGHCRFAKLAGHLFCCALSFLSLYSSLIVRSGNTVFALGISSCWCSLIEAKSFCWLVFTTVIAAYPCYSRYMLFTRLLISFPLWGGALLTISCHSKLCTFLLVEIGKLFPFLATTTFLAVWTACLAHGPVMNKICLASHIAASHPLMDSVQSVQICEIWIWIQTLKHATKMPEHERTPDRGRARRVPKSILLKYIPGLCSTSQSRWVYFQHCADPPQTKRGMDIDETRASIGGPLQIRLVCKTVNDEFIQKCHFRRTTSWTASSELAAM